ncbi:5'-methylthioadenosine/adenosylhomocysteine nucleosidase [Sulfurospirillum deleyianum]|jgi:adenosylhomocysteine/aminodeoxyfutalosine nucleosidase|uniref:adenosylhomocysteine nucleosidase n=1 Tax=Sulfurospirillum deleyianum (strain ATCC 51133 / DSM 6946 / 5175) TaxID=525898 RepID=D1AZU6_SULD5|nr:5'-methylthioadenosine/adenosylhomocysteine nucleosidase [Sulfurospirillum deleyianum]ACZ11563.1 Adenosylhomocysteine nucleosidase [Sulfurospirillum deleyianum DSM 6946]
MKIAIMGAMVEEITPLLDFFGTYETLEFAKNRYYTTTYKGMELVIAYSKIGKVNASLTATTLIEKFGAEQLLFSGVAGALNPNLRIGDVLVATALAQHDLDITAFGHPHGYVPEGSVYVDTDASLRALAHKVAKAQNIILQEGIIATGDQFICDGVKKEWIHTTFKADATEMEGASVAVVCDALKIPFCVLRAISDAADMDAGFSFDEFLVSSAKESAQFIIAMLDELADA